MPARRPSYPSVVAAVLVLLGLLVTSACTIGSGDDDDEATTTTIPEAATLLRVAAADWPACLNPLRCDDGPAASLVFAHVVPKLLEVDADGGYVPSPVLAELPTVEIDAATGRQRITYRIDEDARWHDGRPVTSSDVHGTWQAQLRTTGATRSGYDNIVDVDDSDPRVAVVELAVPDGDWRELFGGYDNWLLQADAFGTSPDLSTSFADELPFGAGAYELVAFDASMIVLAAREDHWDPDRVASIDQIRIERLPEEAASPPAGVDIVLPGRRDLADDGGLVERSTATTSVLGVFFDQRTGPLASSAVRAAIDAGVDRGDLASLAGSEPDAVVTCLGWLPGDPACGEDLAPGEIDAAAADALLVADGWTRNEFGDRFRFIEPLAVPLVHDPDAPRAGLVADALRFRLRALGIVVEESTMPSATFLSPDRGSAGVGVFTVALGTPRKVAALYRCTETAANALGWCDPTAQAALGEVLGQPDQTARVLSALTLGDAAAAAVTWLPVSVVRERWYSSSAVLVPSDQPRGAGPLGDLHRFSIEE